MSQPGIFSFYAPEFISVDTVLSELDGFERIASRETCFTRDEPWIHWLVSHGMKGGLALPTAGESHDYYFHVPTEDVLELELLREMRADWPGHVSKYGPYRDAAYASAGALGALANNGMTDPAVLLRAYRTHMEDLSRFCLFVWAPWALIRQAESAVLARFPEAQGEIMTLEEPIMYTQLERALLEEDIDQVVEKYAWMKSYHLGQDFYTKEELLSLKASIDPEKVRHAYAGFEKAKKDFQTLLSTLENPEDQLDVTMIHTYAFLRTDRIDVYKKVQALATPFYRSLEKVLELPRAEIINLTGYEIVEFLQNGTKPTRTSGRDAYLFSPNKISFFIEPDAEQRLKSYLIKNTSEIREFKGLAASKGTARGIVRVIRSSDDLAKVNAGDVFVAKFTTPRFTPYMLKSAAIVTDEGGIISHAAIISREYKIPCVIGTKVATSVLKDGDIVEVDAEKGIVRKI